MEAKANNNLEVEGKVEGVKTKKERKPFKAGTYKPVHTLQQRILAGETSVFTHDPQMMEMIHSTAAKEIFQTEQELSNDPRTEFQIANDTARLVQLAIAKKLAVSMYSTEDLAYRHEFKSIASFPLTLPTCFVPIINGLGTIIKDKEVFTMVGQPAWVLTYMARAIARDVEVMSNQEQFVNRGTDYFVNARGSGNVIKPLFDLLCGIINTYSATSGPQEVRTAQNGVFFTELPKFYGGIEGWMLLGGMMRYSVQVADAIAKLRVLEPIMHNVQWTQQNIDSMQVVGVRVVNWSTQDINERLNNFAINVVGPILRPLKHRFRCQELTGLTSEGAPWQLTRRVNESFSRLAFELGEQDAEFGAMFGGMSVGVFRNPAPWIMSDDVPRGGKISEYLSAGVLR